MIKFKNIQSPRYANAEMTRIDCIVYFDHLSASVPFSASADDAEDHGREIFERCAAGEFGAVAAFLGAR